MQVALAKATIDAGIVVTDSDAALGFYRDLLGLPHLGDVAIPAGLPGVAGGVMHLIACGDSTIKLLRFDEVPPTSTAVGMGGSTGIRYLTLLVSNLDDIVRTCRDAGHAIAAPPSELAPGVRVGIVEDPDRNWIELIERAAS